MINVCLTFSPRKNSRKRKSKWAKNWINYYVSLNVLRPITDIWYGFVKQQDRERRRWWHSAVGLPTYWHITGILLEIATDTVCYNGSTKYISKNQIHQAFDIKHFGQQTYPYKMKMFIKYAWVKQVCHGVGSSTNRLNKSNFTETMTQWNHH